MFTGIVLQYYCCCCCCCLMALFSSIVVVVVYWHCSPVLLLLLLLFNGIVLQYCCCCLLALFSSIVVVVYWHCSPVLLLLFPEDKVIECGPGQFLCDNNRCIGRSKMCNGNDDCSDGSDERQCSKYLYYRKFSEIVAALGNSATIINLPNNYWGNSHRV